MLTYIKTPAITVRQIYPIRPNFDEISREWKFVAFRPVTEHDEAFITIGNTVLPVHAADAKLFKNDAQPRIIIARREPTTGFEKVWD